MRIKKGLALFLALAMIICLMPASAFASTTATVDKVYAVAADTDMPEVYIDLKVTSPKGIAEDEVNKFKLNLENAEWTLDTVNDTEIAKAVKLTDLNGGEYRYINSYRYFRDSYYTDIYCKQGDREGRVYQISSEAYIRYR